MCRPYSQTKKKQLTNQEKERAITAAVKAYNIEQDKPKEEQRSLWKIWKDVKEDWLTKHKKHIIINHNTVSQRLKGGQSSYQFNMETKAWLKPEEEDMVVSYCLDLASRAFPLNHKTLKIHVDAILQAWLGDDFPEGGVGINWTNHLIERHSSCLGWYWSSSLESAQGRAVNETTN
ncbi:hypothetical protein EDB19DRAFT_1921662 [Suillus lakei]|nr:hypothetical protein EDB19DRAFT_1921662 [Suillus lakei]